MEAAENQTTFKDKSTVSLLWNLTFQIFNSILCLPPSFSVYVCMYGTHETRVMRQDLMRQDEMGNRKMEYK